MIKSYLNLTGNNLCCTICQQTFKNSTSLKIHRRFHDKHKVHVCSYCHRGFYTDYQLKKHQDKHLPKTRVFECFVCRKQFRSASSLYNHQRSHSGHKPFRCDICLQFFSIPYELKKHMIKHTNEKSYACTVCSKSFSRQGSLHVHQRLHTDTEPQFQCDICARRFHWKSNLRSHLLLHSRTNYRCAVCRGTFASEQSLQQHHNVQHSNEAQYQCEWCKKRVRNQYKLNYHMKLKHPDVIYWQCNLCPISFSSSIQWRTHMYEHKGGKPYRCNQCNRTFLTQHNLYLHELYHQRAQVYQCKECNERFTYKRNWFMHIKRHQRHPNAIFNRTRTTRETSYVRKLFDRNRYQCGYCGRGFCYKKSVLKCKHDQRYLRKKQIDTEPTENPISIGGQSMTSDLQTADYVKVQINFVSEGPDQRRLVPLWELNVPAETAIASTPSQNCEMKPIDFDHGVVLVETLTTPLLEICDSHFYSPAQYGDYYENWCDPIDLSSRVSSSLQSLENRPKSYSSEIYSNDEPIDYSVRRCGIDSGCPDDATESHNYTYHEL